MKLAILSCSPCAYSTRRLKEATEQRGMIHACTRRERHPDVQGLDTHINELPKADADKGEA